MNLKIFLMRESKPIELDGNCPLPRWLNCDIRDGLCYMWGIPSPSDEPEIAIRVIDDGLLLIESFRIIIQSNNDGDLQRRPLDNDVENQALMQVG